MKKSILLSTLLILSLSARDNPFASVNTNTLPKVQPKKIEPIKEKPKKIEQSIISPLEETKQVTKQKWTEPIKVQEQQVKTPIVSPYIEQSNLAPEVVEENLEPQIVTQSEPIPEHTVPAIVYPYDPNEIVFIEDEKKEKPIKQIKTVTSTRVIPVKETFKTETTNSTIYDNNFVKIKVENDEVKIVTKDTLLKKFILPSPLRYALDIKKELIKFPSKTIQVNEDVAKTIRIGAHIDFYRISIELNRYKNAHLIETNYGYLLTFK